MEVMEMTEAEAQKKEQERPVERREWERSDWFCRWLELIRDPRTQGAAG